MPKATETVSQLLLMWREAGRHADAAESVPAIARLLAADLPLVALDVIERTGESGHFEALVSFRVPGSATSALTVRSFDRPDAELGAWAASGEFAERRPGSPWPRPLGWLGATEDRLFSLAASLHDERGFVGITVIRTRRLLTGDERELFLGSLEPLTLIVANDFRLRSLGQLRSRAEAERDAYKARLERADFSPPLVGADAGLRQVMQRVRQVAPTDASVLILGETGSGKEVIARSIHEGSARSHAAFVRVNCGAVAPELIDSELFGHEKGAFTGASATRRGWFERADGGTLFLDEIGELAPAVQVRLLRVLQDGIVQRVGGEQEIPVNVRVIAATHRDLPVMVQDGRFREDLWYRIAVFPIILPPLRERLVDLPALAAYFIERAANRAGLPQPPLLDGDLERLRGYNWPGNIREFGAVIERAVILGQGRALALDTAFGNPVSGLVNRDAGSTPSSIPQGSTASARAATPKSFDDAVADIIRQAIRECRGRISGADGAAARLGLNANTLRSKMRKLGMLGNSRRKA